MKYKRKTTRCHDGIKVYDLNLFPNGRDLLSGKEKVIFSCTSLRAREDFLNGLQELVNNFTTEYLESTR